MSLLIACGGSKKKKGDAGGLSTGDESDASEMVVKDAGKKDAGTTKSVTTRKDAGTKRDAGHPDAGYDSGFHPFAYDAAADFHHDAAATVVAPEQMQPAAWSCPDALWNDGHCDCGCSARDIDCQQFSCIEPGCISDHCEACFTQAGAWKPCTAAPENTDWKCDPAARGDGICDCGCGAPDPDCVGNGCGEAGCYATKCMIRHGCGPNVTAPTDACSSSNPLPTPVPVSWPCASDGMDDDCRCECATSPPKPLIDQVWRCPWGQYGAGDGCDCGCGVLDPDCNGEGCQGPRCADPTCDRCSDENGRPYGCDAAQAGWDDDIIGGPETAEPSQCNAIHFGSDDGCDCGCGGHDPDCGKDHGCDEPGCSESACVRCTDALTARPIGCAPDPSVWNGTNKCHLENYGTGDGCDCGCGIPDPDCNGHGCTTPGCLDASCDACNDGAGKFVECPGWVCTDPLAFTNAECDCGCGVIDPYCRDTSHYSCTEPGCETPTCQYCNDSGHVREACGGGWESGSGNACGTKYYGEDGLCDCGCGVEDPDCKADDGKNCTTPGCSAPACEVCHDGTQLSICETWRCDDSIYGKDGKCDCGCGAHDPDCATGAGCEQPGCKQTACDVCHDPIGRVVPCP